MKLWRIKWENIIEIALTFTAIMSWIAFIVDSNVYTLALAVIPTFMTLVVAMEYETLKTFRHEVIKYWN